MTTTVVRRVLLVGELNPYGGDPKFALFPLPEHASGGRLARILGLSRSEYLRRHDRVNLCTGEWRAKEAAEQAQALHARRPDGTAIVLCGTKVAAAFRSAAAFTQEEFQPLSLALHQHIYYLTLPHPSGRNLLWNKPGVIDQARRLYDTVWQKVGDE
jgi:hypothetical protein